MIPMPIYQSLFQSKIDGTPIQFTGSDEAGGVVGKQYEIEAPAAQTAKEEA
jgi:hypothetical protein